MAVAAEKIDVDDIGDRNAPEGTEPWAIALRLSMQTIVDGISRHPSTMTRYVVKALEHRAWTFWKNAEGKQFTTFDEFCAAARPFGLGVEWSKIRPFVKASLQDQMGDEAAAERALSVATVRPAKSPPGVPGKEKGTECPLLSSRQEKHLRAIAERAPEPVRELYRGDLIGAKEAAALGPKSPSPELAATVTEVAIAAKEIAASEAPKTPKEKRAVKKKINTKVREMMGREPEPISLAGRAILNVPYQRLAELAAWLNLKNPTLAKGLAVALKDATS